MPKKVSKKVTKKVTSKISTKKVLPNTLKKIVGYSALTLGAIAGIGYLGYKNIDKIFVTKVNNVNNVLPQVPKPIVKTIVTNAIENNTPPQQVIEQLNNVSIIPLNNEQKKVVVNELTKLPEQSKDEKINKLLIECINKNVKIMNDINQKKTYNQILLYQCPSEVKRKINDYKDKSIDIKIDKIIKCKIAEKNNINTCLDRFLPEKI